MALTTEVAQKIREILAHPVYQDPAPQKLSLYSGAAGYILAGFEYSRMTGEPLGDTTLESLQWLVDHQDDTGSAVFAGGKAGIHWLYCYLYRAGLLEQEDYEVLCAGETAGLQHSSLALLAAGNWDFLHGALGIAAALLYRAAEVETAYFDTVFKELNRICDDNKVTHTFPAFHYESGAYLDTETDLGLAHGLPSVLKFCAQSYRRGICAEQALALGRRLIESLRRYVNPDTSVSYFSSVVKSGAPYANRSRLGWCYGDPGAGLALYQAAAVFGMPEASDLALAMLRHAATRRQPEDTHIRDAGFCHGSAGLAHIFHRMWRYTGDAVFQEAMDFWIQQTLDYAVHAEGIAGYRKYTHDQEPWVTTGGLLEGTGGIALVMMSYLTGDFSWDYCVLLGD